MCTWWTFSNVFFTHKANCFSRSSCRRFRGCPLPDARAFFHESLCSPLLRRWSFLNVGEGERGALISQLAIRIPLLKFSKMPFALLIGTSNLHSVCPFTVSNVSVIDLWQLAPVGRSLSSGDPASSCLFGSSWVVWRQKMSRVLSNTSVKVFFGTKTWGTAPPPSLGYKLLSCSRHAALIKIAM